MSTKSKVTSCWLIFYALSLISVIIYFLGPMYGGTDVYIFRAPACNFADGLGFVSNFSSILGYERLELRLFTSYTPLYPFLSGVWSFLFISCTNFYSIRLFDIAISLVLSSITLQYIFKNLTSDFLKFISALLIGLISITGVVAPITDRPDHLAILFFVLLIILGFKYIEEKYLIFLLAFISSLVFLTSPFFGLSSILMVFLIYTEKRGLTVKLDIVQYIFFSVIWITPVILWVGLSESIEPNSMNRFLAHSSNNLNKLNSYWASLKGAIFSSGIGSLVLMGHYLCAWLTLVYLTIRRLVGVGTIFFWLILFCLPLVLFPYQNNYFNGIAFIFSFYLLVLSSTQQNNYQLRRASVFLVLILSLSWMPYIFMHSAINLSVASETKFLGGTYLASIDFKRNIDNKMVFFEVPPTHYYIFREKTPYLVDPNYITTNKFSQAVIIHITCLTGRRIDDILSNIIHSAELDDTLRQLYKWKISEQQRKLPFLKSYYGDDCYLSGRTQ